MTLAASLVVVLLGVPFAGRPAVETRFSPPAKLTVGDRFDVTFVVRAGRPSLVTGPLPDSLGPCLIVDERHRTDRRREFDETSYRVSFACFAPGRHRLPPLAFLVTSGQKTDTLRSDTVAVSVASVLPAGMKDIHGLKPPEAFPNYALWLVPAVLLALLALGLLARRLLRRLRTLAEAGRPLLPPWEEALNALDALPWREWLAEGEVKRFYYALSEILKRYIERRFEFDAVEQTTTELLASMRRLRLPMREDIGRFFARYDLVKYAKWVPPAEESEQALGQVREFVLRTRPAEPAPEAAAATPARASSSGAAAANAGAG
jgi:hypothetical protein